MHIKEKAKDDRCAAVERDLFNLLLEVERTFAQKKERILTQSVEDHTEIFCE